MTIIKKVQSSRSKIVCNDIQYHLRIPDTSLPVKHFNSGYEEVEVTKGSIVLLIEKEEYELSTGESVLISPGTMQQWQSVPDTVEDCTLTFRSLQVENQPESLPQYRHLQKKRNVQIRKIVTSTPYYALFPNEEKGLAVKVKVFIRTCLEYLLAFKRSTFAGYVRHKIYPI